MKTTVEVKNWVTDTSPEVLKNIHQNDINISIYNRDISLLENEINKLIQLDLDINIHGSIINILNEIKNLIDPSQYNLILQDISTLLNIFQEISNSKNLRLLLATIDNNMCRKFHMDNNDLRLLCTYSGPGTLWLKENNLNRIALESRQGNESIIINKTNIDQAETGSVIILKGAKYSEEASHGVVHRSPTIEENGGKRLLLRIDTN